MTTMVPTFDLNAWVVASPPAEVATKCSAVHPARLAAKPNASALGACARRRVMYFMRASIRGGVMRRDRSAHSVRAKVSHAAAGGSLLEVLALGESLSFGAKTPHL